VCVCVCVCVCMSVVVIVALQGGRVCLSSCSKRVPTHLALLQLFLLLSTLILTKQLRRQKHEVTLWILGRCACDN
jgi:hypothetical protein